MKKSRRTQFVQQKMEQEIARLQEEKQLLEEEKQLLEEELTRFSAENQELFAGWKKEMPDKDRFEQAQKLVQSLEAMGGIKPFLCNFRTFWINAEPSFVEFMKRHKPHNAEEWKEWKECKAGIHAFYQLSHEFEDKLQDGRGTDDLKNQPS
jgi:hypothetical protein